MPRKYQPKTDRKNAHRKPTTLPAKFKVGFLSLLDGRTDLAKRSARTATRSSATSAGRTRSAT